MLFRINVCIKKERPIIAVVFVDIAKTCSAHAFPHQSPVSNEGPSYSLSFLDRDLASRIDWVPDVNTEFHTLNFAFKIFRLSFLH